MPDETDKFLHDNRYRQYVSAIDKALKSFESTSEWADLVSALTKLSRALAAHPHVSAHSQDPACDPAPEQPDTAQDSLSDCDQHSVHSQSTHVSTVSWHAQPQGVPVPRLLLICKRLSQCFHPALPSIHSRALECYNQLFQCLGKSRLSRDLFVCTAGIWPLFAYASLTIRTDILTLYRTHLLPLDTLIIPALSALVNSLLSSCDQSSEHWDQITALLDDFGTQRVVHTLCAQCLVNDPQVRLGGVFYLLHVHKHASHVLSAQNTQEFQILLVNSLCLLLEDSNFLVQRHTLELLIAVFPLQSVPEFFSTPLVYESHKQKLYSKHGAEAEHGGEVCVVECGRESDREYTMCSRIASSAVSVLLRRDTSLKRRLFVWLFGSAGTISSPASASISVPASSSLNSISASSLMTGSPVFPTTVSDHLSTQTAEVSSTRVYFCSYAREHVITGVHYRLTQNVQDLSIYRLVVALLDNSDIREIIASRLVVAVLSALRLLNLNCVESIASSTSMSGQIEVVTDLQTSVTSAALPATSSGLSGGRIVRTTLLVLSAFTHNLCWIELSNHFDYCFSESLTSINYEPVDSHEMNEVHFSGDRNNISKCQTTNDTSCCNEINSTHEQNDKLLTCCSLIEFLLERNTFMCLSNWTEVQPCVTVCVRILSRLENAKSVWSILCKQSPIIAKQAEHAAMTLFAHHLTRCLNVCVSIFTHCQHTSASDTSAKTSRLPYTPECIAALVACFHSTTCVLHNLLCALFLRLDSIGVQKQNMSQQCDMRQEGSLGPAEMCENRIVFSQEHSIDGLFTKYLSYSSSGNFHDHASKSRDLLVHDLLTNGRLSDEHDQINVAQMIARVQKLLLIIDSSRALCLTQAYSLACKLLILLVNLIDGQDLSLLSCMGCDSAHFLPVWFRSLLVTCCFSTQSSNNSMRSHFNHEIFLESCNCFLRLFSSVNDKQVLNTARISIFTPVVNSSCTISLLTQRLWNLLSLENADIHLKIVPQLLLLMEINPNGYVQRYLRAAIHFKREQSLTGSTDIHCRITHSSVDTLPIEPGYCEDGVMRFSVLWHLSRAQNGSPALCPSHVLDACLLSTIDCLCVDDQISTAAGVSVQYIDARTWFIHALQQKDTYRLLEPILLLLFSSTDFTCYNIEDDSLNFPNSISRMKHEIISPLLDDILERCLLDIGSNLQPLNEVTDSSTRKEVHSRPEKNVRARYARVSSLSYDSILLVFTRYCDCNQLLYAIMSLSTMFRIDARLLICNLSIASVRYTSERNPKLCELISRASCRLSSLHSQLFGAQFDSHVEQTKSADTWHAALDLERCDAKLLEIIVFACLYYMRTFVTTRTTNASVHRLDGLRVSCIRLHLACAELLTSILSELVAFLQEEQRDTNHKGGQQSAADGSSCVNQGFVVFLAQMMSRFCLTHTILHLLSLSVRCLGHISDHTSGRYQISTADQRTFNFLYSTNVGQLLALQTQLIRLLFAVIIIEHVVGESSHTHMVSHSNRTLLVAEPVFLDTFCTALAVCSCPKWQHMHLHWFWLVTASLTHCCSRHTNSFHSIALTQFLNICRSISLDRGLTSSIDDTAQSVSCVKYNYCALPPDYVSCLIQSLHTLCSTRVSAHTTNIVYRRTLGKSPEHFSTVSDGVAGSTLPSGVHTHAGAAKDDKMNYIVQTHLINVIDSLTFTWMRCNNVSCENVCSDQITQLIGLLHNADGIKFVEFLSCVWINRMKYSGEDVESNSESIYTNLLRVLASDSNFSSEDLLTTQTRSLLDMLHSVHSITVCSLVQNIYFYLKRCRHQLEKDLDSEGLSKRQLRENHNYQHSKFRHSIHQATGECMLASLDLLSHYLAKSSTDKIQDSWSIGLLPLSREVLSHKANGFLHLMMYRVFSECVLRVNNFWSNHHSLKTGVSIVLRHNSTANGAPTTTSNSQQSQQEYRKSVQEASNKLIEACSFLLEARLHNSAWIRRSLVLRPVQPSSATHSALGQSWQSDMLVIPAVTLLSRSLAPLLDLLYHSDEKEKCACPVLSSVMVRVLPYLRVHNAQNSEAYLACTRLLARMCEYQYTRRVWRRDVFDLFVDTGFFCVSPQALSCWRVIIDTLMTHDKTTFKELMSRISLTPTSASTLSLFSSSRDRAELETRTYLLRRLAFVLFCSQLDQHQSHLHEIHERLVDTLRLVQSLSPAVASVQRNVLMCARVLLLRISPMHVISLWPVIITEMIQALDTMCHCLQACCTVADTSENNVNRDGASCTIILSVSSAQAALGLNSSSQWAEWLQLQLEVCRILHLCLLLPVSRLPQFQAYRWAFFSAADCKPPAPVSDLHSNGATQRSNCSLQRAHEFVPYLKRLLDIAGDVVDVTPGANHAVHSSPAHVVLLRRHEASLERLVLFYRHLCACSQSVCAVPDDEALRIVENVIEMDFIES